MAASQPSELVYASDGHSWGIVRRKLPIVGLARNRVMLSWNGRRNCLDESCSRRVRHREYYDVL